MSGESKEHLGALYVELADHLAQRGDLIEAADCYALGMYYARRTNNTALADLCREQILACQPQHVAAREASAPLFFAQLLMRYPAEEASARLGQMKRTPIAAPSAANAPTDRSPASGAPHVEYSSSVMAGADPYPQGTPVAPSAPTAMAAAQPAAAPHPPAAPGGVAPSFGGGIGVMDYPPVGTGGPAANPRNGGLADLFGPAIPNRAWSENVSLPLAEPGRAQAHPARHDLSHSGFEQHHSFPYGAAGPVAAAARIRDDFEKGPMMPPPQAAPASMPGAMPDSMPSLHRRRELNGWRWLEPIAGLAALAGMAACGFFAYKLWPEVARMDARPYTSWVDRAVQDALAWYMEEQGAGLVNRDQRLNPEAPFEPAEKVVLNADEEGSSLPVLAEPMPRALPPIPAQGTPPLPPLQGWEGANRLASEEGGTTR